MKQGPVFVPGFDVGFGLPAPPHTPAAQKTVSAPEVHVPTGALPCTGPMKGCQLCGCRAEARQVVAGAGPLDARILVVGQNPGDEEDAADLPLLGSGGHEFDQWLPILGLDRQKLLITNAVKCHTARNRVPSAKEIKTCVGAWLLQEIVELPQLAAILTLGKPAAVGVLGPHAPPMTPLMAHHYKVRDATQRELRVFPLPHPAFLLRARHLAPMFRETILDHVKRTMELAVPEAMAWSKR